MLYYICVLVVNFKETAAIFFSFFIDLEHAFARKDSEC